MVSDSLHGKVAGALCGELHDYRLKTLSPASFGNRDTSINANNAPPTP
jgi:hypothetical protein